MKAATREKVRRPAKREKAEGEKVSDAGEGKREEVKR